MGKTPKKAAPGGDESNLYVRRLKATTTASLNSCDTNLPARQRDSENPNRGKAIGVQKRIPVPTGKVFKSKLRSPAATKSHRALKNPPRFQPSMSKDEKKPIVRSTTSKDRDTTEVPTMHPESEEAAVQLKVSITKKDVKDGAIITVTEETITKVVTETSQDHASSNGKDAIVLTETENTTPRGEAEKDGNEKKPTDEKHQMAEEKPAQSDNGNDSGNAVKIDSNADENEADNPSSELEENAFKLEDEEEPPKPSNGDSQEVTKNGRKEQESTDKIAETESQKSAETCSVDVVESTTSEASDSGNATQSDKEQDVEQTKNGPEIDASFISYDSSIMLKDVQIKLNDCLKDNSKLFDVSNANDESSAANEADHQKRFDMSFGKTLRSISGRSTINRLRHVTLREQRFSPNSSLFVNTSSASLEPEEAASCKLLRNPSDFSDSFLTNGSPAERKRKIVTESAASVKKLKAETPERSSILNTSLELLKGIRKPIQVSTPNTKGFAFATDKYGDKGFGDDNLVDAEVEPKKWCVVM